MKLSRVIVISLFMVTAVLLGLRTQKRAVPVPRSEAQTSKAGSEPGISNHAVTTSVPQLSTRQPVRGPGRLGEWMEKYVNATSADERAKLLGEGESVARARRLVLKNLIQQDPEAALQMAIPYGVRKQLPVSIKALLEEPISARGKISLIESSPAPGEEEVPEAWYKAEIDHKVFHVYGSGLKTRRSINGFALMGIAVDDVMALYSAPPILDDAQVADLVQQGRLPMESICSVSGQAASNPTVVDIGGTYKPFCTVSHAQAFQQEYVAASAISEATSAATLNAVSALSSTDLPTDIFGTQGRHRLLVIPVAYADDPRAPSSQDSITRDVLANNRFFEEGSYGTVSFVSTLTPLLTLPQRKTYYGEFLDGALFSDAVAAAVAAGYDTRAFDHIYVVFNPIPGVKFGGRSDGLLVGGAGAISHELGHNFGLAHANYWNVSTTPLPASPPNPAYPADRDGMVGHYDVNAPFRFTSSTTIPIEEYGNPFDVMGSGGGHFSASAKNHMNWLPDKATVYIPSTVPSSQTNRIYAFDTPHISDGRVYAVRVRKNGNENFTEIDFPDGSGFGGRYYWATYRQGYPANPWLSTGIQLNWDALGFSENTLVDTTGDTSPGKNDSAVVIGRTFVDPEIPFYLTPVAQGGGPDPSDLWIDVVSNIGPFPTNVPPVLSLSADALNVSPGATVTFSASATDPNGDVLAYYWDFGDGSFGFNSPVNTKTFPFTGRYVVRCEVSDMKGGKDSHYVVVTVGIPVEFTISGRVVDINGNPVQGVRVHNGGTPPPYTPPAPVGYPATPPPTNGATYRYSYTDSQGLFTIANVPAGNNELGAFLYGYKTEPLDFANPVRLEDGDVQNINFVATPITKLHVVADVPDAYESPFPSPGLFTIIRDGDMSQDLPVRFALGGIARNNFDYENVGSIRTNITFETNGTVITTNYTPVTNFFAGSATIPAGEASVSVVINPIDNDFVDGTRSVRLSLMLATNDFRTFTYLTNKLTTNGTIVITNTLFVTVTNLIAIPGWEAIQTGSDNQYKWFQTYPTYVLDTPAEATLNIFDDESPEMPIVSAFALDNIAMETGNDCASVVFVRFGQFDQDLTVYYNVSGTASNGLDFVTLPGIITIPAGEKAVILPIIALNDLFVEGNEDVTISVADDPAGVYLADPSPASVYIVDDDLPLLSIYAPDSVAAKTGNNGTVTVVRAGDLSEDLVVRYLVTGSAVPGVDYDILTGSVTIPAGQISANITVSPINSISIGPRTVTIILSDSESYNIDNLNRATVTIQDTLPTVSLAVSSAAATEAGGTGVFTVSRTGSTSNALIVRFAVGGTANELSDYAAIGTNVVIPAGSTSATITVAPTDDKFKEIGDVSGADTVIVQLLPGPDYNLGATTSGTVTIEDNDGADLPVISFMLKSSSGREDSGTASIAVRISANPATNKQPALVAYRITGGTAINGTNYSFSGTGRLDFVHFTKPDPGDQFHDIEDGIQFIDIPLLNDGVAAGDKTFTVTLFNFTGYATNVSYTTNGSTVLSNVIISPLPTNAYVGEFRTHTFTIIDVGTTVVSIEPLVPLAFEEGSQPGYFRISRQGSTNQPLTVKLAVSGTAASGSDYVPLPASVTIPAGTNAVILPLVPHDDPEEEYAESVNVSIVPAPGITVGSSSATIVIVDNDGTIQFSRANYSVDEGAGEAVIDVLRTGNTNRAASVDFQIGDGSATAGLDYSVSAPAGTLQFAPGEILQQIRIPIIDDLVVEPNETISLVLTNPTGGLPLGGQRRAILTILDNDISFQFVTNRFLANENGGNGSIVVERLGQTNAAGSVVFSTIAGTADDGSDFVSTNLTLNFEPGETNKIVLIPLFDDELFEGDESLGVILTDPSSNAAVGPTDIAALIITDDECRIEFESVNFSTNEYAAYATVVVRRIGGTVNPFTVDYYTVDGTATGTDTNNLDYVPQNGTLTFNGDRFEISSNGTGELFFQPGDSFKIIRIPLVDDTLGEGNEKFSVVLTNLIVPESGVLPGTIVLGSITNATVTILDDETPGQVDFPFDTSIGANDSVRAMTLQPGGDIVFGGDFTRVNNIAYNSIARLHPNGNLDTSFNPGTGINGSVLALASQSDGKIIVGGTFSSVDNTNRLNLARLNANGKLDLSFALQAGPNAAVRALAIQTNGSIVVGGDFGSVGVVTRSFLARFKADGSIDSGFSANIDGVVNAIAIQPDGKIVVAGAFRHVNTATRSYIARFAENGTLDSSFDPGSGPNNAIRSVALDSEGKILIGGLFNSVGGQPRGYVARLNPNGSLDTAFNSAPGADLPVNSVGVQANGKVVIGGDFSSYSGFSRNHFARLRPDGALDLGFDIGEGANDSVFAVMLQPDTAVILGGAFTRVSGLPRNHIARVHGDDKYTATGVQFASSSYTVIEDAGSISIPILRVGNPNITFDVTFTTADGSAFAGSDYVSNRTVLSFAPGETSKNVLIQINNDTQAEVPETVHLLLTNAPSFVDINLSHALLVIQDDESSIQFSATNYPSLESSNAVITIVRSGRATSDASVVLSVAGGTALPGRDYLPFGTTVTFTAGESEKAISVPVIDDTSKEFDETILISLSSPVGAQLGPNSASRVTILDDDLGPGSVDLRFNPGAGADGSIRALAVQTDGKLVVGGTFTNLNGVSRSHIGRVHTNGAVDLSFNPGTGADGLVAALAMRDNGNIVAGGAFSQVNGTNRNRLAQFLPDGRLDSFLSQSNGLNSAVYAVSPVAPSKLLMAGSFSTPVRAIGRLRSDGNIDASFFPGLGANGTIYSILQQSDARLIVFGDFTTFNNTPRSKIARLQSDGTLDSSFSTASVITGAVYSGAIQADGKILIAGDFFRVNGVDRGRIARLNSDGTLDLSFGSSNTINGVVYALALQLDGKIIVGGDFTSVTGTNRFRIARLNPNGSLDLTFDPGTGADGPVYAVAVLPDRSVAIGGSFTFVNGILRRGLARLNGDPPADIEFLPGSALVNGTFQMQISANAGNRYALEVSPDLISWISIGTNTASSATLNLVDPAAGSFNHRFYRVRELSP